MRYEIRQVDALGNEKEGFEYNETWKICEFTFNGSNERRAFTRELKKQGIVFKPNKTRIQYYGDIYEIIDRREKRPLFSMIPIY